MIANNLDLSNYPSSQDRSIAVRFIEYADPDVGFQGSSNFWQQRIATVNNIFSSSGIQFYFNGYQQDQVNLDNYDDYLSDCDNELITYAENNGNVIPDELLVVTGPFYVEYQSDCLGGDYGADGDCDDTGEEPQFDYERGGIKEMFGNIIYLYVEGSGSHFRSYN